MTRRDEAAPRDERSDSRRGEKYAPAMGMIGTLVGLLNMFSAMDDPKSIGPAMAALLTTMYGAILANMIFGPMSEKLRTTRPGKQLNRLI